MLSLDPPCSSTTQTGSSLTLRDPRKTEVDKQGCRGQSHWIKIQIARGLRESHPNPYFFLCSIKITLCHLLLILRVQGPLVTPRDAHLCYTFPQTKAFIIYLSIYLVCVQCMYASMCADSCVCSCVCVQIEVKGQCQVSSSTILFL